MQLYRTSIVNAAIMMPNKDNCNHRFDAQCLPINGASTPADSAGIVRRIDARRASGFPNARVVALAGVLLSLACNQPGDDPAIRRDSVDVQATPMSRLATWDDGLAEICYYDAVETIYGTPRQYTRVMLANREWLNPDQMVKTEFIETSDPRPIPVFKTNIIEEIPTENYNYRYMLTLFLSRPDLRFEKLSASSQEWCGTTFKRVVRGAESIQFDTFSYFEGEADRSWALPGQSSLYPREALFLLAREVASTGDSMTLDILPKQRSTHTAKPKPQKCSLSRGAATRLVRVPFGSINAYRVVLSAEDGQSIANYDIEFDPPYRVVYHDHQDGLQLKLRYAERRAYWDRSQRSRYYKTGSAP